MLMRKIIIFINVVLIFAFLISTTSKPKENEITPTPIVEEKMSVNINILVPEDFEDIAYYQDCLSSLPGSLLKEFNAKGWVLCILYSLEDGVSGYTDYENKKIVISDEFRSQAKACIIHEFGHFLDYSKDYVSYSEEFTNLYNSNLDYIECEYYDSIIDIPEAELKYATSNARELFATIFKEYILNRSYLRKNYPELFEYIKKTI